MKKFIALFAGAIIATGAAAQTDRTSTTAVKSEQARSADRQPPASSSDRDKRANPAAEPEDSANSVSTDFQGSSSQPATSSGMGQPKPETTRPTKADKTGSDVQDVEDKTRK